MYRRWLLWWVGFIYLFWMYILIHSFYFVLKPAGRLTHSTVGRSGHRRHCVHRTNSFKMDKSNMVTDEVCFWGLGTMCCCYCCWVCVQYVCAYSVLCRCICACMHIWVFACTATVYVLMCLCIHVCVCMWGGGGPQGPALCLSHLPPHSADTQGTGRKDREFILAKRNQGPVA